MFRIGCHLSSSKGYLHMGKEALSIGATTFQFFTRNPRGSRVKPLDEADIAAFRLFSGEHDLPVFVAHAPYTINPCSAEEKTREFARQAMQEDIARLELLPHALYNFHPGSHVGQGSETAISLIADSLNAVMAAGQTTTILLETMAGKSTEVGRTFEELRAILDRVTFPDQMGICLDTCHVFDGGYDIVHDLDGVLTRFDAVIGLDRIRAVHLNDSKNPLGSHKDRHENIGKGYIGLDSLARIINHPALRELPFCLETPCTLAGYAQEISLLKGLRTE